jgi:hypothetical protein
VENNEFVWHREVIDPQVERTLNDLRTLGVLERCYLAGGTGLALHLGHRRSHDLDFFSRDAIDTEALTRRMKSLAGFALAAEAQDTLHVTIQGVKVSFLAYPYPVLFPFVAFQSVNVADPRDIACMKLSAIASRGTKRDFIDLYMTSKQYGVAQVLEWFRRKYADVNPSPTHLLKSLTWFEDAEKDPMPDLLGPLTWEAVKKFFRSEAPRLAP